MFEAFFTRFHFYFFFANMYVRAAQNDFVEMTSEHVYGIVQGWLPFLQRLFAGTLILMPLILSDYLFAYLLSCFEWSARTDYE